MTDTISDMLTRIRNAIMVKKPEVSLPYSKFKHNLAKLLVAEGWLKNADVKEETGFKTLVLGMKYDQAGEPTITGLKRVSKPGQRIYTRNAEIPRALGGVGMTVVSTSRGLMTDKNARTQKVGGEIICQIW
jgi:small subunit ribosomal protein S8